MDTKNSTTDEKTHRGNLDEFNKLTKDIQQVISTETRNAFCDVPNSVWHYAGDFVSQREDELSDDDECCFETPNDVSTKIDSRLENQGFTKTSHIHQSSLERIDNRDVNRGSSITLNFHGSTMCLRSHTATMNVDRSTEVILQESRKPTDLIQQESESTCHDIPSSEDSDYIKSDEEDYEEYTELSEQEDVNDIQNGTLPTNSGRHSDNNKLNAPFDVPEQVKCTRNQVAELSKGPKGGQKKNFCFYCHKEQSKIARHLISQHSNERDVKKFTSLPEKSAKRLALIARLRKKGNFLFNANADFNRGRLIPVRRPRVTEKQPAINFVACRSCHGHYSVINVDSHYRECTGMKRKKRPLTSK